MNIITRPAVLLSFFTILCLTTTAQERPIGSWRSHMPYNKAVGVATDGVTLFVATEETFYTYNFASKELTPYSKVEGMADVGMSAIGYDATTGTAILAYSNSNIDLYKEGNFTNLPDIKLKSVAGLKNINNVYAENGLAYLSTSLGIVVVNLEKKEIKETYTFTKDDQTVVINSFTADNTHFYAATEKGLYRAPKNTANLQAFSAWQPLDTTRAMKNIAFSSGNVLVATTDSIFKVQGNSTQFVYGVDTSQSITHLDPDTNGIFISVLNNPPQYDGSVIKLGVNNLVVDSFRCTGMPRQVIRPATGDIFIADAFNGLKQRFSKDAPTDGETIRPAGPAKYSSFDIYAHNKEVWVAHGGVNDVWVFSSDGSGFSSFKEEKWTGYSLFSYHPFGNDTYDFTNITKGPDGSIYAGSSQSGLFVLKPDGSYETYRENSIIDESFGAPGKYRISGLAFDDAGNLWMTVFGGNNELVVKAKDGNWYEYFIPSLGRNFPHAAAHLIIDDNGQKWYAAPRGGGVFVFDDNGTLDNIQDDNYTQLTTGKGSGNLPDNEVYTLVKDRTGSIWIGTANGIGIVNCPGQVIDRQCEADLRVVQFDQFAGYLFQNEAVRAIAVDGGNRKWIGTNNGMWLISPEGDAIIERFTIENSPLPSNRIQTIKIDQATGDVYIGTERGLVSYRGASTEGGTKNADEIVTYPSPVPSGYSGTIAMNGFVENADVRITDISGQLVYRTKALGGQAVWNGLDYTGRRPQSGVYLIFASNKDGSETAVGKLVFME